MRVTNMRGVDISKYSFDFDLTFAALTLNANGQVYHRYGGRDVRSATQWTTEDSFAAMLLASLAEHARYASPTSQFPSKRRRANAPLSPERIPAFAKRDKGACIHCHNVNEALHDEARAQGTWKSDDVWIYPEPAIFGIDLDRDGQRTLSAVRADSPAAKAGLQVGDVLLRVGASPIATATDVMFVAEEFPMAGGELAVEFARGEEVHSTQLVLPEGWKRGTPQSFAWRALKWNLEPVPGFGGPDLGDEQRQALGIRPGEYAFRVQYLVTSGPRRNYGEAAARAGVQVGDVVIEIDGKRDFESQDHFHAWWRLTRKSGSVARIKLLREGELVEIELPVAP